MTRTPRTDVDYTSVYPFKLIPRVYRRDVEPSAAQRSSFARYAQVGDPLADALVAAIKGTAGVELRKQFEQALTDGIDAVPDAPEVLRAFFSSAEEVPFWVDQAKLDRASEALRGLGFAVGPIFMIGYAVTFTTPDGNAVLLRSGDARDKAGKRAAETLGWVNEISQPGALEIGAAGYQSSVRVRLTHAFMRSGFSKRGDWDLPNLAVNQQVFSNVIIAFAVFPAIGALLAGKRFNRRDREAIYHFWRYVGYLTGVDQNLLLTSEHDAIRLAWLFFRDVIKPDADATLLGTALIDAYPQIYGVDGDTRRDAVGRWFVLQTHTALSRLMLGRDLSDWLGFPRLNPAILPFLGLYSAGAYATTLPDVIPAWRRLRSEVMGKLGSDVLAKMKANTNASMLSTLNRPIDTTAAPAPKASAS